MTLGNVRGLSLEDPRFGRLVESELLARGQQPSSARVPEADGPPFVQILTDRTVERFLRRYFVNPAPPRIMVIVSPFIGDLAGEMYELKDVLHRINADRTRTYVITRAPRETYQHASLRLLSESPYVEIRHNRDIHAKLYICSYRDEERDFALFGSGNLTAGGLRYNLELGMMILARGHGKRLIHELYDWSASALRTKSERVKAIQAR